MGSRQRHRAARRLTWLWFKKWGVWFSVPQSVGTLLIQLAGGAFDDAKSAVKAVLYVLGAGLIVIPFVYAWARGAIRSSRRIRPRVKVIGQSREATILSLREEVGRRSPVDALRDAKEMLRRAAVTVKTYQRQGVTDSDIRALAERVYDHAALAFGIGGAARFFDMVEGGVSMSMADEWLLEAASKLVESDVIETFRLDPDWLLDNK